MHLNNIHVFCVVFQIVTCPSTSFTDLAEIVSRIEPVKAALVDGELAYRDSYMTDDTLFWVKIIATIYEVHSAIQMLVSAQ